MSEENREDRNATELVNRYEQMIANNDSYYFDIEQFEEIVDYYCGDSKFTVALQVINYAYSLFPENSTLMLLEAQILTSLGHLAKALNRLKTLERLGPNEEVLLTLASVYSQQREHAKAIQMLLKALHLGSEEYQNEIYLEIALEYQNMDRYDKAQEILQEAISKHPENEVLLYELAYVFDVSEKTAECIEYYQQFLEKHPFSFPAWYNLANAYQKINQLPDAIECYDYCIAIQEDFTPAYYNKAHTLFKMDKYQEAVQVFEETYAYEQPQAPVYCHIGECFEKLNQLDKALFYYKKSIQTDEHYGDAYLGLGITLDLLGRPAEALAHVHRAIELEPENADYHLFHIEFLKKLNRFDEAEVEAETLAARFPDNEDVWLDYSDIYFQKGDHGKAIDLINIGWQKCPQSNEIGYRKVAYLIAAGKTAEGEELMLRLASAAPEGLKDLEEYFPEITKNTLFAELISRSN
jgi:tetratricopeptide (TPR) repeat protein